MASRLQGLVLGLTACSLLAASSLRAQEPVVSLDTVQVDVQSRASDRLGAGTRAVEVIGAAALRSSPATTVSDALRWAFGVDLMARSPALADVAIRGSTFEQVLVLVDGVRIRDGQTGHFNLDLAVPLEQVERIEVLRGPASALYGADAMGGVINVVTRREGGELAARVSAGSFGTAGLALSRGVRVGAVRADLAGELHRSDGHRSGTDYEMGSARVALAAPLAGEVLTADLAVAAKDFGADGFYAPFPSYERTRTTTGSLRWRATPGDRVTLEPLLSVRRHGDDFILRRDKPDFYRNRHTTLQLGGELVGRVRVSDRLHAAAGLFAYRDEIESRTLGDHVEGRTAATAEIAAGEPGKLTATGGLRADWHQGHPAFLSPAASLAWWPASRVRLRGAAGRAFRSPTWTDRYYRDPANVGDPELAPERAWSAEAGVDAFPVAGLRLAATVSLRQASDLIDWAKPVGATREPWRTRNVEEARFEALEAEIVADDLLGARWALRGSWTSLSATAAPEYISKYALRPLVETLLLDVERAFPFGVRVSVLGARARRLGEEAYFQADARLAYRGKRAGLFLDLRNALDEGYLDIAGKPGPGRSAAIGVEWRGGK